MHLIKCPDETYPGGFLIGVHWTAGGRPISRYLFTFKAGSERTAKQREKSLLDAVDYVTVTSAAKTAEFDPKRAFVPHIFGDRRKKERKKEVA